MCQQKVLSKLKVPTLTKYAMNDISIDLIKSGFSITGICPLSAEAIPKEVLVSDAQTASKETTQASDPEVALDMGVESIDTNNNDSF